MRGNFLCRPSPRDGRRGPCRRPPCHVERKREEEEKKISDPPLAASQQPPKTNEEKSSNKWRLRALSVHGENGVGGVFKPDIPEREKEVIIFPYSLPAPPNSIQCVGAHTHCRRRPSERPIARRSAVRPLPPIPSAHCSHVPDPSKAPYAQVFPLLFSFPPLPACLSCLRGLWWIRPPFAEKENNYFKIVFVLFCLRVGA